jgi:hypothetical protein
VHAGDRRSHEDARESEQPPADSSAIEDYKGDRAADDRRDDREEDEKGVLPNENGQLQRKHPDEVHAPDA